MNNEIIEKIKETLQKELNTGNDTDLIEDILNSRLEEFHKNIIKNIQYKKYKKKISKIEKEIITKFKNFEDITNVIERHNNATCELEYLTEKLMYKFGVLDGLLLIIQCSRSIDDFFKENNFMGEEING